MLPLGDLQYEKGILDGFRNSYDKSWGAMKSITKPVVGNHESLTPGAAGFYGYFSTVDKRGYYVFQVGGWRVYVLNSNCDKMDCGAENLWFNQQLRDHPAACALMAMHHPRYSFGSGAPAPAPSLARSGEPPTSTGSTLPWPAMTTTTSGSGGWMAMAAQGQGDRLVRLWHRRQEPLPRGPEAAICRYFPARRFGVLKLTLGAGTWSWNYRTTGGTSLDSGTNGCV